MAITVYDSLAGFMPIAGPVQFVTFKVGAGGVKKNQVVKLSSGTIVPVVATGGLQIGVTTAAGAAGDYVAINIDPETIYEATADDQAAAITDIGKYLLINAESSTTDNSNQTVDLSGAATSLATNGINYVFQVVGLPGKVTNTTAALNKKVYVKMITGFFEPYVDA